MEKGLKEAHEFLDAIENALTGIPLNQKKTFFAGILFEDFSKIIKRERNILDLSADNFILKKELYLTKKQHSLE